MYCCISSCTARSGKNRELSFYRFPKSNESRRARWIEAAGRGNEIDYNYAAICSRHFITGRPARITDCDGVDWVPTLLLPNSSCEDQLEPKIEPAEGEGVEEIYCFVRGCEVSKQKYPTMLFFPIPQNDYERNKWLLQIGMRSDENDFKPDHSLHVCELHFELSEDLENYDKIIAKGGTVKLKDFVMPTRNIPTVLGHQVARYSYEATENIGNLEIPFTEPDDEVDDDEEEESLLVEMSSRSIELEQSDQENAEEYLQVCRSCLNSDATALESVFEDNMAETYYQFTSLSINEAEGISTMICRTCKRRLLDMRIFRENCITSTQVLIHRYQKYSKMSPSCDYDEQSMDESMDDDSSLLEHSSYQYVEPQHHISNTFPEELVTAPNEEPDDKPPNEEQTNNKPGEYRPTPRSEIPARKRYKCEVCRKEYNSKAGMVAHMTTHKNHDPSEFTIPCESCHLLRRPNDKHSCRTRNYFCHICAAKFSAWSYLKIHLARSHSVKVKRKELAYQLQKNNTSFLKRATHADTGKGNGSLKTNQCGFCNRVFKTAYSLKEHRLLHNPVQLTQCNECNETFQSYFRLQVHHDQHSSSKEEINKTCEICSKVFNRRQTMLMHRQYYHNDKAVVQCSDCSNLYSDAQELAEHNCDMKSNSGNANIGSTIVQPEPVTSLEATSSTVAEDDGIDCSIVEDGIDEPSGTPTGGFDTLRGVSIEVIELESDDDTTKKVLDFNCSVCGKVFVKKEVFDRHMNLHRMMKAANANAVGCKK